MIPHPDHFTIHLKLKSFLKIIINQTKKHYKYLIVGV